MGADELRAFLGGRRTGDRCLYVSTGGFTKEARYEAERSNVPLTLVTLPKLRELLLQHYERLDPVARALVPLQRLYWPVVDRAEHHGFRRTGEGGPLSILFVNS